MGSLELRHTRTYLVLEAELVSEGRGRERIPDENSTSCPGPF